MNERVRVMRCLEIILSSFEKERVEQYSISKLDIGPACTVLEEQEILCQISKYGDLPESHMRHRICYKRKGVENNTRICRSHRIALQLT